MANHYQNRIDLLQGTLDLLILQTLRWGPSHAYGISQVIRANSNDILQVDTGSLYPALHRLERQKWIAAECGGKKHLVPERSLWKELSGAIARVLEAAKGENEA